MQHYWSEEATKCSKIRLFTWATRTWTSQWTGTLKSMLSTG